MAIKERWYLSDFYLYLEYIFYKNIFPLFFVLFFYRLTFVGFAWSFVFFIPATTANDLRLRRIFYPRFYPLHLFSYLNYWERSSIFPLVVSAKQGHFWYHFITSLVWRGLWLGIEPGTARTRSQNMFCLFNHLYMYINSLVSLSCD